MREDRDAIIGDAFSRRARAFAASKRHRDPERLRVLLAFLAARPGERLLDVGCGPGIVMAAVAATGLRAVGVDLATAMLREAVAAGGGPCVRGHALGLPFRDGAFDVVVTRNTLHHLADPPAAIREMARVVRPGGRVVIEDLRAPDDPAKREYLETIERLRDVAHLRMLTKDELETILADAGLLPAEIQPVATVIEFEEWLDGAGAPAGNRTRARALMEACLGEDRCGLRVWREGEALRFERLSLLAKAARP